jgi:hypothetical protein
MYRPFLIVFLISPFLASQVRVSTNGSVFKTHERIDVQVTNAGKDAVSYCIEVGQTSSKAGNGTPADVETTSIPFYVQSHNGDRWGTLMIGPDVGSSRQPMVLKPGESQRYPFRLSDRGQMRIVLDYWRGENERVCKHPSGETMTTRSKPFIVN